MIVGDIKNWKKIILDDRTILRSDLMLFNSAQIDNLSQLKVKEIRDKGRTLVCCR